MFNLNNRLIILTNYLNYQCVNVFFKIILTFNPNLEKDFLIHYVSKKPIFDLAERIVARTVTNSEECLHEDYYSNFPKLNGDGNPIPKET
jgi:hypothetical protein